MFTNTVHFSKSILCKMKKEIWCKILGLLESYWHNNNNNNNNNNNIDYGNTIVWYSLSITNIMSKDILMISYI